MRRLFIALLLVGIFCVRAGGNTITAASCTLSAVQSAVSSASLGDTVIVPAGASCDWTAGISISGISLIGAGKTTSGTVITAGTVSITKSSTQHTRLSGFRFTGTDTHASVKGNPTDKAYIIDTCYFFTNGGAHILDISVNGGLLHHNDFLAPAPGTGADVFSMAVPIGSVDDTWSGASGAATFGNTDTTGERNIYFEDNTFTYILETAPDGDRGTRLVFRHNTWTDSSIVFHSGSPNDSSQNTGNRQFEIYNNTFHRVDNNAAINKWIWARGQTGVIANNAMDRASSPDGSTYPNKPDIELSVGCPSSYPIQYQIGQSAVPPENPASHPLLVFGNTGGAAGDSNFIHVDGGPVVTCSNPANYIQVNRDYYASNQWNWTPYTYPHPLTQGFSSGTPPAAPSGLSAAVH